MAFPQRRGPKKERRNPPNPPPSSPGSHSLKFLQNSQTRAANKPTKQKVPPAPPRPCLSRVPRSRPPRPAFAPAAMPPTPLPLCLCPLPCPFPCAALPRPVKVCAPSKAKLDALLPSRTEKLPLFPGCLVFGSPWRRPSVPPPQSLRLERFRATSWSWSSSTGNRLADVADLLYSLQDSAASLPASSDAIAAPWPMMLWLHRSTFNFCGTKARAPTGRPSARPVVAKPEQPLVNRLVHQCRSEVTPRVCAHVRTDCR